MSAARTTTLVLLLAPTIGCVARGVKLVEVFPAGSVASPWRAEGPIWTGPFEEAAVALGDDAEGWRTHEPQRAWLARYAHDQRAGEHLLVRALSFAAPDAALRAFEAHLPLDAQRIDAGDAAGWTADGILVRWGRLVFDIFGDAPSGMARPEQAVYLFAFIERRMPDDLPDDPR